jgi:hypothetical protein
VGKVEAVLERRSEPGIPPLHGLTQAVTPQRNLSLRTVKVMLVIQEQRSVLTDAMAMAVAVAEEARLAMGVQEQRIPLMTVSEIVVDLVGAVSS